MSIFSKKHLLSDIVGKFPTQVNAVLGNPQESVETQYNNVPNAFKSTYCEGRIEVVFINGIADWVTDNSPQGNRLIRVGDIGRKCLSINKFEDYGYYKWKTK
jgi:hypothetical protein